MLLSIEVIYWSANGSVEIMSYRHEVKEVQDRKKNANLYMLSIQKFPFPT